MDEKTKIGTSSHHVCPECGGVSKVKNVCNTEGCHLRGSPLEVCYCPDGKHFNVLKENP